MSRVRYDSLVIERQSSKDIAHPPVRELGVSYSIFTITFSEESKSGEVWIEQSDDPIFTGNWAMIFMFEFSGPNSKSIWTHIGPLQYIRARIVKPIEDGVVSVRFTLVE